MKAYVGVTDAHWYELLRTQPNLSEANFWQPGGNKQFRALVPGELFLFKLHHPNNFIVGGGLFAHSSLLPTSLAWESFGLANGAPSLAEMRRRIEQYRRAPPKTYEDYTVGCILLEEPFFLPHDQWIPVPSDWKPNIVQGRIYDLTAEPGLSLWRQIDQARGVPRATPNSRFGAPTLAFPRLGQGTFRVLVTDAYDRRCTITGEKTLPALEAAHIMPYSEMGEHRVENGLLLRRDLHALFDRGYISVTPDFHVEVSKRIKEEFDNGREYYRLHGQAIRHPENPLHKPNPNFLQWHTENCFKG